MSVNRNFLFASLLVVGCYSADKEPVTASTSTSNDCPAGMVKKGGDCVAPDNESGPGKTTPTATSTATTAPTSSTSSTPAGEKTPYDKDAVAIVFNRATNQVKVNCGQATDDTGKASGPWGITKAQVRLGRNGHVRGVEVPPLYADKPVGTCVVHAFQNLIFPPYAAPDDVVVPVDIEIVRPAGAK